MMMEMQDTINALQREIEALTQQQQQITQVDQQVLGIDIINSLALERCGTTLLVILKCNLRPHIMD